VVLTEHYLLASALRAHPHRLLPPVRSDDSRALDLDDLITMPGCAKTMRAMTKLERPAIAIMPSPWDKD